MNQFLSLFLLIANEGLCLFIAWACLYRICMMSKARTLMAYRVSYVLLFCGAIGLAVGIPVFGSPPLWTSIVQFTQLCGVAAPLRASHWLWKDGPPHHARKKAPIKMESAEIDAAILED